MNVWVLAVIIVLFFEGAMLSVAPKTWQEMMRELIKFPPEKLRKMGLGMTVTAILLLFFLKWMG